MRPNRVLSRNRNTADKLRNQILHLCDVIGHTCNQRAGAKAVHLRKGEGHQPAEGILTDIIADILPGHMHKSVVQRATEAAKQNQAGHFEAQRPNQAHIPHAAGMNAQNAVIGNPAHQLRLQQVHQYLPHHKRSRKHRIRQIPLYIFPHIIPLLTADMSCPNGR